MLAPFGVLQPLPTLSGCPVVPGPMPGDVSVGTLPRLCGIFLRVRDLSLVFDEVLNWNAVEFACLFPFMISPFVP